MNVVLLLFLAFCTRAKVLDSHASRNERLASDENFKKELEEGYQLLKGEPNADDTKKLLEQLHRMEPEIKKELTLSPEREAELQEEMKNYVETENDHLQPMGDTIEEVNAHSKVDRALYQGDILLTKEQAEEIIEDIEENEAKRNKRQAYRDSRYPKTLWPKRVHYSFYNATENAKRVFRKAAQIWQNATCINFAEDNNAQDKIVVIRGEGCWSLLGRKGGDQRLSLGRGCELVGHATHEIGHALGFYHTQARHDRDDFITVYAENFDNRWLSQQAKQSIYTNYNYDLTYDYGSVMHYGATSVSRNGRPVFVPRDIKYMQTLGSPIISFYEKLMMNLHYKCLDECKGRSVATCQNGGFPHPRECNKCICPSGYGGHFCSERPSGCGTTLTATNSYQTLEDTVGQRGVRRAKDEYMMCNYWIQGPPGSTIEVVLDSYSDGVSEEGCGYAAVEIKTGSDKRHTGYRFCSPRYATTKLVSTHNVVPIITYSAVHEVKTVLRYRIASTGRKSSTTKPPRTTPPKGKKTNSTPQPTKEPNPDCKDNRVCTVLLQLDFCNAPQYNDGLRKQLCPKSCGFCR